MSDGVLGMGEVPSQHELLRHSAWAEKGRVGETGIKAKDPGF